MADRITVSSKGPGAPKSVKAPGRVSAVGKKPPALPNVGNPTQPTRSRRDYGKAEPAMGAAPQPFGSANPFGDM